MYYLCTKRLLPRLYYDVLEDGLNYFMSWARHVFTRYSWRYAIVPCACCIIVCDLLYIRGRFLFEGMNYYVACVFFKRLSQGVLKRLKLPGFFLKIISIFLLMSDIFISFVLAQITTNNFNVVLTKVSTHLFLNFTH